MKSLTIVLPIRDIEAQRLYNCLFSLKKQTSQDFEIIISDFGSKQKWQNHVQKALKKINDPSIKLIYTTRTEDWNRSEALNHGFLNSKTPYIMGSDADIVFPDDRQFYCKNDHSFTITGVNTVNDIGTFTIEGGVGLTDNNDNTATINPKLLNVDTYTITYTYFDGTTLQVNEDLTIGNTPIADFKWETECFQSGQAIDLIDNSVPNEGSITDYKWLFYQGSGYGGQW